jgi:hypothetical protein
MELAEHLLKQESDECKIKCIDDAFRLCHQITLGFGLGEPYYLVLDNDVLNALQKPNIRSTQYIALILLFRTIKKQKKDFRIAINPAIYFEFNGEKAFQNSEAFENGWADLNRAVAQTELPIFSYGLDTLKQAKAQLKSIKHDIKAINAALVKIKSMNWKVNLRRGIGVTFPHVIAREKCPKIKTKYFSTHHTRLFLASVIESKIIHHKDNDNYAKKKLRDEGAIKKSKLLEYKKGRLTGVGDLSLISLCDIGSQFHHQAKSTSIAITFDKRLERTLIEHSRISVHSQHLIGGQEDKNSIKEKMNDFFERSQIVKDVNEDAQKFIAEFASELKNTTWLSEALESK